MATSVQTGKAKQLTLLGFFAITASMVMAVYEYPTFATSGFSLVFFLLLGGILWFIPVGLCAAEMATVDGWEEGGVFAWVSNTLGPRWGFAAISFGYLQIAIGFIPMLYFVLGALSYILKWPALNEDPITKTIAALIILWALALTQFGGTKYTARIAKVGFFAGILLPAFILIALAAIYLHSGAPVAIEMDAKTFFPDFSKVGTLVVFVAFILSYMGVEASATHVNEMSNPGLMAFIVSFLPPDNIQGDSTDMYVELLVVSFLVVLALPFILYAVHDRKSKANTGVTLEPINSQNAPKGHFFLHPRARSPHYIVMNDKKH
ncbi:TPA: amino acid permease [Escherichia coli]